MQRQHATLWTWNLGFESLIPSWKIPARGFFFPGETDSAVVGLGLGLAIAKSLVDGMGGEIGIESEPGKGTTVKFDLPAAA